jgi:hypothetical protein
MTPSERTRPFPGAWPSRPCSLRRTPSRARIPGPSPLRSLYSVRNNRTSQPVRGSACSVRRQPVLFIAACSSGAHCHLSLLSLALFPSLPFICLSRAGSRPASPRRPKIPRDPAGPEWPRQAQRPRQRPAPLCSLKASLAGVQVCAPAWHSRPRVGDNLIPGRHQAKQIRLDRAGTAPHTHPDRWRGPEKPRGPPSHFCCQAYSAGESAVPGTVPANLTPSPGGTFVSPAERAAALSGPGGMTGPAGAAGAAGPA